MRTLLLLVTLAALSLLSVSRAQVSLNVATGTVGLDYELLQSAVTRFMRSNPDITVRLLYTPELTDDRLVLLRSFFEAGTPELDVIQLDTVWTIELANHLHDLSEIADAAAGIDPRLLATATVNGRLVSMPWFTSLGTLFYRSDLLAAHGFTGPPRDWSELESMARTIQASERAAGNTDFWGYVWQGNDYEGLTVNALEWFASSGGGTIIDAPGVVSIANVRVAEILGIVRSWIGDISPPEVLEFTEEDTFTAFVHGKAAFMRGWPTAHALLHESPRLAGRYGVALLPTATSSAARRTGVLGGSGLAVSRYSSQPEAAFRLVTFLTSPEEQRISAVDGARIPSRPSLYADPAVLQAMPHLPQIVPGLDIAIQRPVDLAGGQWSQVSRSVYTTVHELLLGHGDPGVALGQLAQRLQLLTGLPTGRPQETP